MNPLKQLQGLGQSPWLDFMRRNLIGPELDQLIERDGLGGMTSNPSIFEKAIGHESDYDEQFQSLMQDGDKRAGDLYEALAIQDIQNAADHLRPIWDRTDKHDGFVSLEVSPYLALDTEATIAEAKRLWKAVDRPNLMVKVPGTKAGVPAIAALIGEGININVTLLFAQDAYVAVAQAFMTGLEKLVKDGKDIGGVASVASFFVSRIDVLIDKQIDAKLKDGSADHAKLESIKSKVAIANAKLAYQHYKRMVESSRWQALAAKGAQTQRLLWASTGTKNPALSDVLYVDGLIGADTVNTMPPATMDAFRDHGIAKATIEEDVEGAKKIMATLEEVGISMAKSTEQLVDEGVKLFEEAFDKLLGAVEGKRAAFLGGRLNAQSFGLSDEVKTEVDATLDEYAKEGKIRRVFAKDSSVWTGEDEGKWLGWLDIVQRVETELPKLEALSAESAKYKHVLLLGMGGSSLGPEVLAKTFGHLSGHPELLVLDSTDPAQIKAFEDKIDPASTLFIVSSKSGGTLEPNILKQYFFEVAKKAVGESDAGKRFVAVTDPGSHMQQVAETDGFAHIFYGDPAIGGRYSVLSNFGMVPAAAAGVDVRKLLDDTLLMVRSCGPDVPATVNPGVQLGAVFGVAGKHGRDKVTIFAGPGLEDFGAWAEQLIAESTGKKGKGLIPVDAEPIGDPSVYGTDRVFAHLSLKGKPDPAASKLEALEKAGHPVVRIVLDDAYDVGQEFYRWEIAVAVAGTLLSINTFDQPDVEASKVETKKLTSAFEQSGKLPDEKPFLEADGFKLFADSKNEGELTAGGQDLASVLKAHFARLKAGDYAGFLAYVQRKPETIELFQKLRVKVRDAKKVATVVGFGPRFLHSTGQAYKGGPNSGVFLQITADDAHDLEVPQQKYTFSVVKAAQARGDFDVLSERGRRALRIHITGDLAAGLEKLSGLIDAAIR